MRYQTSTYSATSTNLDIRTLKKRIIFLADLADILDIVHQLYAPLLVDLTKSNIICPYYRGVSTSGNKRTLNLYQTNMTRILVNMTNAPLGIKSTKLGTIVEWMFLQYGIFIVFLQWLCKGTRSSERVTLVIRFFKSGKIVSADPNYLATFPPGVRYLAPVSSGYVAFVANITQRRKHIVQNLEATR